MRRLFGDAIKEGVAKLAVVKASTDYGSGEP